MSLQPQQNFISARLKGKKKVYILGLAQKRKSFLVLSASIREDPCLMLYRFNPYPQCPQRKIFFFWILPAGLQKITNSDKK